MKLESNRTAKGEVHVENIGGIEEATVEFSPGCTLLVGRNATNRTSFLQSLMAALGSDDVSIKGDAEEAYVELTLGEETYTRQVKRGADGVLTDGDPYLESSEVADLFAFLLESNEARLAVSRNENLREIIMRPIDTETIETQIDQQKAKRDELKNELEEISDLQKKLPDLEAKRSQLTDQIEAKRSELEEMEAELDAKDTDVHERRKEKKKLQSKLDELRSKREELDDTRYDIETERESLDALRQERHELEDELEELVEISPGEIEEISTSIDQLRKKKQSLEGEVKEIQDVIRFNDEMLTEKDTELLRKLTEDENRAVTDQLVEDEITCWTCGSRVDRGLIESTIDTLRTLSKEKVTEISNIEEELEELTNKENKLKQAKQKRGRIQQRCDELSTKIEKTEETIEQLQEQRKTLEEEVKTVEKEVDNLEEEDYNDVLDLHREANELEYQLGSLESDLDRVNNEIASIEDRINERSNVADELEAVRDKIVDLRTKIQQIEETAVEEFNDHMNNVLQMLDYDNLDRIWLERVGQTSQDQRRTVDKGKFELHVVRKSGSGVTYEDTIGHLSESEREVTGLVFALAGYLAHEVYEDIPFMLLDSVEAIDSDRIAGMVQYLTEYTDYLLVALLPEDAAALPGAYDRVRDI